MENDREILEGFLKGDAKAARELLVRLRPACVWVLLEQHLELEHVHADILDAVETTLLEWRVTHLAGEPRFDLNQSIKALAWRLTKQEAKNEARYWQRYEVTGKIEKRAKHLAAPSSAEDSVEIGELVQEISGLPEDLAEVLMAEADRAINGGPPLEERLGISAAAARKRLERARSALKDRLLKQSGDE